MIKHNTLVEIPTLLYLRILFGKPPFFAPGIGGKAGIDCCVVGLRVANLTVRGRMQSILHGCGEAAMRRRAHSCAPLHEHKERIAQIGGNGGNLTGWARV